MAEETKNQGFTLDGFFESLHKTFAEAVKPEELTAKGEGDQDPVAGLTKRVAAVEAAITGEGEHSVQTLIKAMNEVITELRSKTIDGDVEDSLISVMSKTLDRVVALEGGAAVQKSIDGDTGKGDEGEKSSETPVSKGNSVLGNAIQRMAVASRNGGRGSLTLT